MSDESRAGSRPEKSAAAFRTISEVSGDLEVPQHLLRFWETKFAQVRPMKRAGGRRYYRPEDIALLRRIRDLLYAEGYTIRGVQKLLRERGVKGVVANADAGAASSAPANAGKPEDGADDAAAGEASAAGADPPPAGGRDNAPGAPPPQTLAEIRAIRQELVEIRALLAG